MKTRILFVIVLALLLAPGAVLAQEYETGADPQWSDSLSQFVQLLLYTVAVPALVTLSSAGIRWLKAKALEAKAKLPGELIYTLETVAKMAVAAAEQSGLADLIANDGKAKKAWAMRYAENMLRQQYGLILDLDSLGDAWWQGVVHSLDGAIEAGVQAQNVNRNVPEGRAMVTPNDFRAGAQPAESQ